MTKTTIYKGEQVEVELRDMIVGRIARDTVRNPITDETIVEENQIITNDIADKLKELKLESIRVRSPLTCEAPRGVFRVRLSRRIVFPLPKETSL